jgi:hypothetical protein
MSHFIVLFYSVHSYEPKSLLDGHMTFLVRTTAILYKRKLK